MASDEIRTPLLNVRLLLGRERVRLICTGTFPRGGGGAAARRSGRGKRLPSLRLARGPVPHPLLMNVYFFLRKTQCGGFFFFYTVFLSCGSSLSPRVGWGAERLLISDGVEMAELIY